MSKPTPRPWRDAGEDGLGGVEFIGIEAGEEGGPTYRRVAWVMSNGGPDYNHLSAEDRANAAHLIKCVNLHDELVDMARFVFEVSNSSKNTQDIIKAGERALALLAKAEGRDE